MGRTVLVTGGAGFLGINLARHLLAEGWTVRSLDLAELDVPDLQRQVDARRGDVRDPAAVSAAIDGVDAVVHAAAALPLYPAADIFSTDVEGTRVVLESARRAGLRRVVHISSTAVYGIPDHAPIREDDRLVGVGPYGEAKIRAEAVCREFRGRGLEVPVLRPATFVGPERLGVFEILYDWAADGHHFPMLGQGDNRVQMLHVADLCRAISICLTADRSRADATFNIGAREFGTMREDYQAVLDEAGFGKRVVAFPAGPAVMALRVLDRLGLSPIYRWVYEVAIRDSIFETRLAEERLGFRAERSNRDALVGNFRWYLENRPRLKAAAGVSHRVPWKQGAVGLLKKIL